MQEQCAQLNGSVCERKREIERKRSVKKEGNNEESGFIFIKFISI